MSKLKALNRLLFTVSIISYLIALLIYGYWDYSYNKNEIQETIDSELYNSAATLKYIMPDDFHDRAIDEQAILIKEDKYIANKLTKLTKETGFKYAYTIIKKGGKLFFVASDLLENPGTNRGTFYFFPYEGADASFINAFDKEEATYKTVSDQWGTVRTVMIPEESPGGVKYLACADYDISYVSGVLRRNLLRSIVTVLLFLLMAVPIAIIYIKLRSEYLDSLRDSEERYRELTEFLPLALFETGNEGNIIFANKSALQSTGYNQKNIQDGINILQVVAPEDHHRVIKMSQQVMQGDITDGAEYLIKRNDGSLYPGFINTRPSRSTPPGLRGYIFDLTSLKNAEKALKESEVKLKQAQKMEAIGTLAGGIAHDFNNILAAILAYTELSLLDIEKGTRLHAQISNILISVNRATELVKQILTLSRHSGIEFKPTHVIPLVKEALKMLRSTIPTSIDIQENICDEKLVVHADPTQIHQVIVNLATNAKHAIQESGGIIMVAVDPVSIDENNENNVTLKPGNYVRITVNDNGIGIKKENLEKIFEPYFTTKAEGEGSGLGLSVVHGIVTSHHGDIAVQSEPGKGTTVRVYLPLSGHSSVILPSTLEEQLPGGTERILLVDDEPSIAKGLQEILERLGYTVDISFDSRQVLEAFRTSPDSYDMVITDMTMPIMTGDMLASEIKKIRPDVPVILCTGFSEKINFRTGQDCQMEGFLLKPVRSKKLAEIVRKLLDAVRK